MSFEVVYTSAPRGLHEGTSGFCTVACTKGIPRTLLKKLESLSGYSHAHPAGSGKNPVNFAHSIVSVQQKVYHVLSRIADAGPDHTGRSNKIAHHLAIPADKARAIRGGPLALLRDRRFWFKEWNRKPTELPANRMPTAAQVRGGDFGAWEDVFGDAGWAGMLGAAAKDKPKPVMVIVPSAEDSLELLGEAMQLVAPAKRWKVGFSTYYAQTAGECHWRFVVDGTESARKARARSAALVIDHRAPASLPRGNPFVEAARNGDPSSVLKAAPRRERPTRQKRKAAPIKASREAASSVSEPGNQYRGLRPSQVRRKQAGARARAARRGRSDDDWDEEEVHEVRLDKLEEGTNRNMKPIWIGSIVTILAVAGFLAYQYWPGSNNSTPPPTTDTNAAKAAE